MNVRDVQKLQLPTKNRRIKVRQIAEVMNTSKERFCHILNQHLGMRSTEYRVRALGAAFAHGRPKTCSNEDFQRSVGAV